MARGAVAVCGALLACSLFAAPASAGAGSGFTLILPPDSVLAGSLGTWNVTYIATEDFATTTGGTVDIVVPPGWTAPQATDSAAAGYVRWTDAQKVDSLLIAGQTIRVYLGGGPHLTTDTQFLAGNAVSILYGAGAGPASARAQTSAPATAVFQVLSDPQLTGSPQPIALPPSLFVFPDTVVSVDIVDASGASVDAMTRTTDQDSTRLFLRGYDTYGNPARLIPCDWTVSGGIGAPVPPHGAGTTLRLDAPGAGVVRADSAGVWADSTGLVTVLHGAYAGLAMTAGVSSVVAGSGFAVTARARDADGNTVTDGAGSVAAVRFIAFADSVGAAPADPRIVSAGAALSGGTYSGSLAARSAGAFYFAVTDTATGFVSERHRVVVAPAGPDHVALRPDTLRLTAGAPDTVSVRVFDAYGNPTPVLAPETPLQLTPLRREAS